MHKHRLSASVEADLVAAAEQAVSEGLAESVSAWVNLAMRRQVEHDRRLRALDDFIAAHEAAHGVITAEEIDSAVREARATAIVVRPRIQGTRRSGSNRRVQRA